MKNLSWITVLFISVAYFITDKKIAEVANCSNEAVNNDTIKTADIKLKLEFLVAGVLLSPLNLTE